MSLPFHPTTLWSHTNISAAIAWSPHENALAAAQGSTLCIWKMPQGTPQLLIPCQQAIMALAWHPAGRHIATGGDEDGVACVWDSATGKLIRRYRGHSFLVHRLAWSPDGKFFVTGSWDFTIRVWEATTSALRYTQEAFLLSRTTALCWVPHSTHVATTCSWDGDVHIWEALTGIPILDYGGHRQTAPQDGEEDSQNPPVADPGVQHVACAPDGDYLASVGADGRVDVWGTTTGKLLWSKEGRAGRLCCAVWSPDRQIIMVAGAGGVVRGLDATTGRQVLAYSEHRERVVALAWSPDSNMLASVSEDGQLSVWAWNTAAPQV